MRLYKPDPDQTPGKPVYLSQKHRRMLLEESGISPEIAAERGTFTARRGKDVPQEHGWLPSKPGMVFPVHPLDGSGTFCRLRLNNPGRLPKYMQPKGHPNRLDVHPRQHERIKQPGGMRYVTEGEKKVDAGVSRDLLMIGQSGVFNGQRDRGAALIDDWDLLPIEGEQYSICYDSDIETNPMVQLAADRQARLLRDRGAEVFITLLPPAPDGVSKQGLDDFFANGGTVRELEMLTHPYDFDLVIRARLSRDEKLGALVEDLERRHAATRWTWPGADADEDLFLVLIENAKRRGKVVGDGLRVVQAQGPLAPEAAISSRTVWKGLNRLEARGFLYRDNKSRKSGKPGAFVLRAGVSQKGGSIAEEGKATRSLQACDPGDLHLRAPRLWASRPKWKPTKKMIREHRLGVRTWMPEPREGVKRPGKKRGHCIDRLDAAGGTLTLEELGEKMGIRRRDLVRRKRTEKGRDGLLIWLQEAGIVVIDGDTVSLTPDWRARLEKVRQLGGETSYSYELRTVEIVGGEEIVTRRVVRKLGADEVACQRYREKSRAFHNRNKAPESKPSSAGLAAVRRSQERRDARLREIARAEEERRRAGPPSGLGVLICGMLGQLGRGHLDRLRMGLLCEVAMEEGFNRRDVPEVVRAMGYRVERLAEYNNAEFIFAKEAAA